MMRLILVILMNQHSVNRDVSFVENFHLSIDAHFKAVEYAKNFHENFINNVEFFFTFSLYFPHMMLFMMI